MIKVTCVRIGTVDHFNRKFKGKFARTFKDLYELSNWMNSVYPKVCFVDLSEELTKEQIKWLSNRRKVFLNRKRPKRIK
jgi:hypothetical protein